MVLSLRVETKKLDPTMNVWDKFMDRFSESMRKLTDQLVESLKQACQKTEPKDNRRVLICGATQEDDCLCVVVESMDSELYQQCDAITDFEEEEVNPCTRDVDQTCDKAEDNTDPVVPEVGDINIFHTVIGDFSPQIHQVCNQLDHSKVNFLSEFDFSSPKLVANTVESVFVPNKKVICVGGKVFDKSPQRDGYVNMLNPKPPDKCGLSDRYGGVYVSSEFTFDPCLASLHTYLGEVDDTQNRLAFLDGGAVLNLPIFYLEGVVLFLEATLPLRVIQPNFIAALERALRQDDASNTQGVVQVYRDIGWRKDSVSRLREVTRVSWPYWAYRMFDSYCIAQQLAEMWKKIVKASNMDGLVKSETLWLNGQQSSSKLNDSIDVLQNMLKLTQVWLHMNSFSGPTPDLLELKQLQDLSLQDNSLTGPVTESMVNLPSLVQVNLTNNMLQGSTPNFNSSVAVDMSDNTNSFCLNDPGVPCDSRVNKLLTLVQSFGYSNRFAENWKGNDPCPWLGLTCDSGNITIVNFQKIILWNPMIRKSITLPKHNFFSSLVDATGFGFDPLTNDYKVIRIVHHSFPKLPSRFEFYSLNEGGWRNISGLALPYEVCGQSLHADMNGAIHWVARGGLNALFNLIILFDLHEEMFREIMLPDSVVVHTRKVMLHLVVAQESLSLICHTCSSMENHCHIWIMKEYGRVDSWTKQYRVEVPQYFGMPLRFNKNGEIVLSTNKGVLFCYDSEDAEVKSLDSYQETYWRSQSLYVESKMGFSGSISPNFSSITSLQKLLVSNNILTGVIPDEIDKCRSWLGLDSENSHYRDPSIVTFVIKNSKDVVSWTSMISCYVHNGLANEALALFFSMIVSSTKSDSIVLVSAVSVTADLAVLRKRKELHGFFKVFHDFLEVVFQNNEKAMQTWHLDDCDFLVVGYGYGLHFYPP